MAIVIVAYLFACSVTAMIVAQRKGNFWKMFVISIFCSPIGVLVNEGLMARERPRNTHQSDNSALNQF